jgi:glycosyltransferase involved in cell wall biosynthesis
MITFQYPGWPTVTGGGIAPVTHRLAKSLHANGDVVHVIAPGPHPAYKNYSPVIEGGITVHRTSGSLGMYPGELHEYQHIADYVARLHSEVGFDVLHGHFLIPPGFMAALLSRRLGIPAVASIHGEMEFWQYDPVYFPTVKWVLESASVVTAPAESQIQAAVRIANMRSSRVIANAFDPEDYISGSISDLVWKKKNLRAQVFVQKLNRIKSKGSIVIGTSAILRPEKGFDVLLDAFGKLHEKYPQTHLLVIGDFANPNRRRKALEDIKKRKLKRAISFTGRVAYTEVLSWMRLLDIFVLPSLHEASPMALLEAMYCRLPVVASETGGIVEMIEHETDGLLVPTGDADALTHSLARLIEDEELAQSMGERAHLKVLKQFSPSLELTQWMGVYEDAMRDPRALKEG